MQRLVVSQLFLAEKTNGQFKKLQPPLQPRLQFGRNSFLPSAGAAKCWAWVLVPRIISDVQQDKPKRPASSGRLFD
jgi:hypothetical protein